MLKILSLRIKDSTTLNLLKEVIASYTTIPGKKIGGREAIACRAPREAGSGMPIGNLTSQIFANIYLNELDRFVQHQLKPRAYLRYGDDFILVETDLEKLKYFRTQAISFLQNKLKLQVNPKSDKIMKSLHGLKYLGVKLWPTGRTLNKRNRSRTIERLNPKNISSYSGLLMKHGNSRQVKHFNWVVYEKLLTDFC